MGKLSKKSWKYSKNLTSQSKKWIQTQQEEELVLHLAPPSTSTAEGEAERPKVTWTTDTVDNEHMQKKKSKCCCIYKKHKNWQDSSDDDSDSVSNLNRAAQMSFYCLF